MVTVPAAPGAVKTPDPSMDPAVQLQVTLVLIPPVPVTVAVKVWACPPSRVTVAGLTEIPVTTLGAETVTVAVPVLVASQVFVAVTV